MIFGSRKGLAFSLVVITVFLFLFAIISAFTIRAWDEINSVYQSLPDDVADSDVKQKISDYGSKILWADKIFTYLFIVLIIGYLVTSFSLEPENLWFYIIYTGVLILVTILSMTFSNAWKMFINNPELVSTLVNLSVTNFVLTTMPFITFFTGLFGGVIFYMRSRESGSGVVGGGEVF